MTELLWQFQTHLWLMFGFFLICMLLPMEIGLQLGIARRHRLGDAIKGAEHSDITLPALLALLGLMLAFTYSFSLGRADNRKDAVVAEVNALGTSFLRADLLDEPARSELQQALYDYALTRNVAPEKIITAQDLRQAFEDSMAFQARLWPLLMDSLREADLSAPEKALLISAMTGVLDTHNQMRMAVYDRLPYPVLVLLLLVGGASLAVAGYNSAMSGHPARLRMSIFGIILACLIFLIVDLDMPLRGFVAVNLDSLETLVADMRDILAERSTPGTGQGS